MTLGESVLFRNRLCKEFRTAPRSNSSGTAQSAWNIYLARHGRQFQMSTNVGFPEWCEMQYVLWKRRYPRGAGNLLFGLK